MKIKVTDKNGVTIFTLSDKYHNLGYDAKINIFTSFLNKECKVVVDER